MNEAFCSGPASVVLPMHPSILPAECYLAQTSPPRKGFDEKTDTLCLNGHERIGNSRRTPPFDGLGDTDTVHGDGEGDSAYTSLGTKYRTDLRAGRYAGK